MAVVWARGHAIRRRQRTLRYWLALGLFALGLLTLAQPARPAAEYELRVAMIFNIARFVQWPAATADSPFTFCTLGANAVADALPMLNGRQLDARPVSVRAIRRDADLVGCQLVYLAPDQALRLATIADRLKTAQTPALTISDAPGFLSLGGMVQLITVDDRQRFRVNQPLAQQSGLTINAKLLQLALPTVTD